MKTRRTYSAEFKQETVRMIREQGRTVAAVARSLGIDRSVVAAWQRQLDAEGPEAFPGKGRLKPSDLELQRVRRELAQVCQERDILKKALAYFAKQPS